MGADYKNTFTTKPLPAGAQIIIRKGQRLAEWKDVNGIRRTARVTTGNDGADRIVITARTYTAGIIQEVETGCRDESAARSLLGKLERRAELIKGEVLTAAEDAVINHQVKPLADRVAAYLKKGRHRKRFCDLQKIVLRLGLFQFPLAPENGVDVYYREVLERMSWQERGIENCTEQYQRTLVDLDFECSAFEADGILTRVKDGSGRMIGVRLTQFGVALAVKTSPLTASQAAILEQLFSPNADSSLMQMVKKRVRELSSKEIRASLARTS